MDTEEEKLKMTMEDLINVARKSMQFNVVGVVLEEVLASLLKIPIDDVKHEINSKILANIENVFKFLPPSLFINVKRRDNGWYGSAISNNGADFANYELIDVGGDGTSVHGITPISSDGEFDINNRNPPYDGGKILWNFAIAFSESGGSKIQETNFVLPENKDTITEIIFVI